MAEPRRMASDSCKGAWEIAFPYVPRECSLNHYASVPISLVCGLHSFHPGRDNLLHSVQSLLTDSSGTGTECYNHPHCMPSCRRAVQCPSFLSPWVVLLLFILIGHSRNSKSDSSSMYISNGNVYTESLKNVFWHVHRTISVISTSWGLCNCPSVGWINCGTFT